MLPRCYLVRAGGTFIISHECNAVIIVLCGGNQLHNVVQSFHEQAWPVLISTELDKTVKIKLKYSAIDYVSAISHKSSAVIT